MLGTLASCRSVLWALALLFCAAPGLAQSPEAVDQTRPAAADQLLKLLADPAVQAWLKNQAEQAAQATPPPAAPGAGLTVAALDAHLAAIRAHIERLAAAARELPQEFERLGAAAARELAAGSPFRMILAAMLALAWGLLLQWLFRRATVGLAAWPATMAIRGPRDRLLGLGALLVLKLGSWLALAAGIVIALIPFHLSLLSRRLVLAGMVVWLAALAAMRISDVFLAPVHGADDPLRRFRLLPLTDTAARFWRERIVLFVGWFVFAWVAVHLVDLLGVSAAGRDLLAYTLGLGLLVILLEMIWARPAAQALPAAAAEAGPRRRGQALWRWVLSVCAGLAWVLWVAGAMRLFWLVVVAAAVPLAIRITRHAIQHVSRPGEIQEAPPAPSLLAASIERGAQAGLILLAIAFLAWVWNIDLIGAAADSSPLARLVRGVLDALIIVLAADLFWHVAKTAIDMKLSEASAQGHSEEEAARRARLRTLLPILRNVLLAALIVVAGMMALAALGVNIGPLIAGAGVIGVAIGFGAQTLVKDIISGMFYLFDDAFRVGDYIQSGSHKGTVEGFSLRSIRLRHQRGPIYTVPFGELGAVENLSRDWVIDKQTINVTYDTDLEQVRKIIKDIGQKLKADPELAPHIIDTLKMQGVQEFGDYAIQIRMKLTTKPGEQFVIRRKAFAMIKKAFEEKGIKFARPVVHVAGGSEAEAAAAQQALALRQAGEAAGPA
ncbi:mechanosensitive ion channel family protein [Rhodoligotrophos defluvii]|uniref:mechanosensitive ion channel family protein n=1 Tax=Rhodoligotrophos defluvii TaxID=2561934 RepID=UPI00148573A1|nr:mechanosensitive ion channel domain-containing protein [Rhodoligotrophos defluvii]